MTITFRSLATVGRVGTPSGRVLSGELAVLLARFEASGDERVLCRGLHALEAKRACEGGVVSGLGGSGAGRWA